jgi:hypothetical protein
MDDAAGHDTDGACPAVCTETVGEDLDLVSVLLRSEHYTDRCSGRELLDRGLERGEDEVVDVEFHISEAEGGVVRASIFSGSKEKVEGNADDICNDTAVFRNGAVGSGV